MNEAIDRLVELMKAKLLLHGERWDWGKISSSEDACNCLRDSVEDLAGAVDDFDLIFDRVAVCAVCLLRVMLAYQYEQNAVGDVMINFDVDFKGVFVDDADGGVREGGGL